MRSSDARAGRAQVAPAAPRRSARRVRHELPEVRDARTPRTRPAGSRASCTSSSRSCSSRWASARWRSWTSSASRSPTRSTGLARRDPALHAHDPGARDARHRRGARRGAREDGVLERLQGARPLVGGAAAVLSRSARGSARRRSSRLLVAYGAAAPHLPDSRRASTSRSTPSSCFRRSPPRSGSGCRSAGAARSAARARARRRGSRRRAFLLGLDSAANVAKLGCYALVGFCFLTLFEELWWLALVAVLVPWVDVWSVAAGPTEYVVEEKPGSSRASPSRSRPPARRRPSTSAPRTSSSSRSSSRPRTASAYASGDLARDDRGSRNARARLDLGRHRRPARASRRSASGSCSRTPTCSGVTSPQRGAALDRAQAEQPRPTRRAACAGTCPRAGSARARSRTRRAAPVGPTRASSGCTRRRRSAARRARPFAVAPCPRGRRVAGRRRRRRGCRPSAELLDRLPDVPAKKRAFSIPFSSAFSIAHATASSEISRPHTARALAGEREPDRPGPAVEVVDVLLARRGPRTRARARTAALPSRCSSGGTRTGARGSEAEDLLLDRVLAPEQLRREVRLLGGRVVDRPVDRAHLGEAPEDVHEVARLEPLARSGHEHDERLARVPTLADDEVTQVPRPAVLVVRLDPLLAGPVANGEPDRVAELRRQEALLDPDDLVPAPRPMEPQIDAVLPRCERVLELVPVANSDAAGTIGSSGGSGNRPMRTSASRTCRSFSASCAS